MYGNLRYTVGTPPEINTVEPIDGSIFSLSDSVVFTQPFLISKILQKYSVCHGRAILMGCCRRIMPIRVGPLRLRQV